MVPLTTSPSTSPRQKPTMLSTTIGSFQQTFRWSPTHLKHPPLATLLFILSIPIHKQLSRAPQQMERSTLLLRQLAKYTLKLISLVVVGKRRMWYGRRTCRSPTHNIIWTILLFRLAYLTLYVCRAHTIFKECCTNCVWNQCLNPRRIGEELGSIRLPSQRKFHSIEHRVYRLSV